MKSLIFDEEINSFLFWATKNSKFESNHCKSQSLVELLKSRFRLKYFSNILLYRNFNLIDNISKHTLNFFSDPPFSF